MFVPHLKAAKIELNPQYIFHLNIIARDTWRRLIIYIHILLQLALSATFDTFNYYKPLPSIEFSAEVLIFS